MWAAKMPNGPSIKLHVQNVHTMDELKMTGNCLKGSRGLLSFDKKFEETEWGKLTKEVFTHVCVAGLSLCLWCKQLSGMISFFRSLVYLLRRERPSRSSTISSRFPSWTTKFGSAITRHESTRSKVPTRVISPISILDSRKRPIAAQWPTGHSAHRDRPTIRDDAHPDFRRRVRRRNGVLQPWYELDFARCSTPS